MVRLDDEGAAQVFVDFILVFPLAAITAPAALSLRLRLHVDVAVKDEVQTAVGSSADGYRLSRLELAERELHGSEYCIHVRQRQALEQRQLQYDVVSRIHVSINS